MVVMGSSGSWLEAESALGVLQKRGSCLACWRGHAIIPGTTALQPPITQGFPSIMIRSTPMRGRAVVRPLCVNIIIEVEVSQASTCPVLAYALLIVFFQVVERLWMDSPNLHNFHVILHCIYPRAIQAGGGSEKKLARFYDDGYWPPRDPFLRKRVGRLDGIRVEHDKVLGPAPARLRSPLAPEGGDGEAQRMVKAFPHDNKPAELCVRPFLVEGRACRGPVEVRRRGRVLLAQGFEPGYFKDPPKGEEALGLIDNPEYWAMLVVRRGAPWVRYRGRN